MTESKKNRVFNSDFLRICLASLMLGTGNQIVMVVLPLFLHDLDINPTILGIATSLSAFAAMSARPIAGSLSDKVSRKMVFIIGASIMIIGMLGLAFLPMVSIVIAVRLIQGFGISAGTTSQMAIAADVLPETKVSKGLAYFGMCGTIASAFGPMIGFSLVFGDNYLPAWLGGAAIFLLGIVVVATLTYEKKMRQQMKEVDRTVKAKSDAKGLWRFLEKKALLSSSIQLLLMLTFSSILHIPTYAVELEVADTGLFYTLQAITMLAANIGVGNLYHMVRNPLIFLIPAGILLSLQFVFLFMATSSVLFFVAAAIGGLGFGTMLSIINVVCMSTATPERRGVTSATLLCAGDIGYAIGSIIWGAIAGALGFKSLYGVVIVLPIVTVLLCIYVFAIRKRKIVKAV